MKDVDLQDLIQQHIFFQSGSPGDWQQCVHLGCDHGNKGPRAGFLFSGDSIAFNCFNCGVTAGINLNESTSIPQKLRDVLRDFGIPDKQLDIASFNLLQTNNSKSVEKKKKHSNMEPAVIELPPEFKLLEDYQDHPNASKILEFLKSRGISLDAHPFLFMPVVKDNPMLKSWMNRLIIPMFKGDDLIYYQGRTVLETVQKKYINASDKKLNKKNILTDYDVLFGKNSSDLYVVEGWFDAFHIDGVGLLGNILHDEQISWLNKSMRRKVYIPDRSGRARDVAKQCLDAGWNISVPYARNSPEHIKDVSDMIKEYGKLYTMMKIKSNISEGEFHGTAMLQTLVN